MAEEDYSVNKLMRNSVRFADLYNGTVFRGKQVLKPEDLSDVPDENGIAIVGLEVGFIYAYKAGWTVSTASVVQSAFLAVALIAVGFLLYREAITWNKVVGIVICLIGLVFINK